MSNSLKLLVPALIPSWRFFDVIAASPRVEFRLSENARIFPDNWQEFRPRPTHLTLCNILIRLFWNPRWNESLFLVSLAERIDENREEVTVLEMAWRIKNELERDGKLNTNIFLQFRLVFMSRQGEELQKQVTFVSSAYPARAGAAS